MGLAGLAQCSTASTGQGFYPSGDGYTEFKASYTLPAK